MTEWQRQHARKQHEADFVANKDGVQSQFSTPQAYAAFKEAEADGRVKTSGTKPTTNAPAPLPAADAKAQAEREWLANTDGVRGKFIDQKTFIAYRTQELQGNVRSSR